MAEIHVEKGGGQYSINASKKRKKEGCMTFGSSKMIRECVFYYDKPTVENCTYFLGKDITVKRYCELMRELKSGRLI